MSKFIQFVKDWFHAKHESYQKKAQEKRATLLRLEAMSRLQEREFHGKMFLCFDNVPILETEDLTESLAASVLQARLYYIKYKDIKNQQQ